MVACDIALIRPAITARCVTGPGFSLKRGNSSSRKGQPEPGVVSRREMNGRMIVCEFASIAERSSEFAREMYIESSTHYETCLGCSGFQLFSTISMIR